MKTVPLEKHILYLFLKKYSVLKNFIFLWASVTLPQALSEAGLKLLPSQKTQTHDALVRSEVSALEFALKMHLHLKTSD